VLGSERTEVRNVHAHLGPMAFFRELRVPECYHLVGSEVSPLVDVGCAVADRPP
jgi:hypothetical protein